MPAVRRNSKAGSQPALLSTKLSPLLSSGAKGSDIAIIKARFLVSPRNFRSIFTEKSTFEAEEAIAFICVLPEAGESIAYEH